MAFPLSLVWHAAAKVRTDAVTLAKLPASLLGVVRCANVIDTLASMTDSTVVLRRPSSQKLRDRPRNIPTRQQRWKRHTEVPELVEIAATDLSARHAGAYQYPLESGVLRRHQPGLGFEFRAWRRSEECLARALITLAWSPRREACDALLELLADGRIHRELVSGVGGWARVLLLMVWRGHLSAAACLVDLMTEWPPEQFDAADLEGGFHYLPWALLIREFVAVWDHLPCSVRKHEPLHSSIDVSARILRAILMYGIP